MDMVFKLGKMILGMKGIGQRTERKAKVNYITLMVILMRVNGQMIKLMDMVPISIKMALLIMDSGFMICKMDMGLKNGLMEGNLKVNFKMGLRMERVTCIFRMVLNILVIFLITL